MTSFTHLNGQVQLSGTAISDHRIEDLLTFFEREAEKAEAAAKDARAAFNLLWEKRCEAVDFRQNRRAS